MFEWATYICVDFMDVIGMYRLQCVNFMNVTMGIVALYHLGPLLSWPVAAWRHTSKAGQSIDHYNVVIPVNVSHQAELRLVD